MTWSLTSSRPEVREIGRLGGSDRFFRRAVHKRLSRIRRGSIVLIEGFERFRFGDSGATPRATVRVESADFYRALAVGGAVGGAEAYIDGLWTTTDLTAVIRVLASNSDVFTRLNTGLARLMGPSLALFHKLRRNTRSGSRRNIAAHYDLGNEFFELFLDPTMTYSSGIFEHPHATMEDASVAKYERICQKLDLRPDDHVLEIGTGWGGFAIHAASRYGCRVTTTTISERQLELARERVRKAGLEERVNVLFEDYRDLTGRFDKLVSIEMIEAVGHEYLDEFFQVCSDRLSVRGAALIQGITIPDRDYETHCREVDFIKRYIFPGGQLVSVGAMTAAAAGSDLRMAHFEDFTPHYAETLRRWREKLEKNAARLPALGLDEAFRRMWEFYLCYCEGGFEERVIGVAQLVFEKPDGRRDWALLPD